MLRVLKNYACDWAMDKNWSGMRKPLLVKSQNLKASFFEYWFAARVSLWLCWLPIFLRIHSLPILLQRLKSTQYRHQRNCSMELERAVRIVVRVCYLRLFRLPIFPRPCLRQSLALYRTLIRMGYPVEIKFGVHKDGNDLQAHSWVTLEGKPVADRARKEKFTHLYSYSSASYHVAINKTDTFQEG